MKHSNPDAAKDQISKGNWNQADIHFTKANDSEGPEAPFISNDIGHE